MDHKYITHTNHYKTCQRQKNLLDHKVYSEANIFISSDIFKFEETLPANKYALQLLT